MTMSDAREVLSALIDREPVDPDVLAALLEEAANRRLLVDFVRLRAAVRTDEDEGAARHPATGYRLPAAGHRADVRLRALGSGTAPSGSRGSRWIPAAAVFVLLAIGAGGGAWLEHYMAAEKPPQPHRVVRFEPGVDWAQLGGRQ
jgi:hypothetical protein